MFIKSEINSCFIIFSFIIYNYIIISYYYLVWSLFFSMEIFRNETSLIITLVSSFFIIRWKGKKIKSNSLIWTM